MKHKAICNKCKSKFQTNKDHENPEEHICYNCALESITDGQPPQEGDFNTARVVSDEITDEQRDLMQQDLEAVESGRSIREYPGDCDNDDDDDPFWCYQCDQDIAFCKCICLDCGKLVYKDCFC